MAEVRISSKHYETSRGDHVLLTITVFNPVRMVEGFGLAFDGPATWTWYSSDPQWERL